MTAKNNIDPRILRQLLDCDTDTGTLTWKRRPREMFKTARAFKTWNTRFAGKEAFTCVEPIGYRTGGIFGTLYKAHRVIWAIVHGEWPEDQIDHINRDKADNRLSNLRPANQQQQSWNSGSRGGSSRFKGVYWHKVTGKWAAHLKFGAKVRHLGLFTDETEAAGAYAKAARKLHGEFAAEME